MLFAFDTLDTGACKVQNMLSWEGISLRSPRSSKSFAIEENKKFVKAWVYLVTLFSNVDVVLDDIFSLISDFFCISLNVCRSCWRSWGTSSRIFFSRALVYLVPVTSSRTSHRLSRMSKPSLSSSAAFYKKFIDVITEQKQQSSIVPCYNYNASPTEQCAVFIGVQSMCYSCI